MPATRTEESVERDWNVTCASRQRGGSSSCDEVAEAVQQHLAELERRTWISGGSQ